MKVLSSKTIGSGTKGPNKKKNLIKGKLRTTKA